MVSHNSSKTSPQRDIHPGLHQSERPCLRLILAYGPLWQSACVPFSLCSRTFSKGIQGQQASSESCPGGMLWDFYAHEIPLPDHPCHYHPWRHPCQLRIGFVCKSRDLSTEVHTHRGWSSSAASMRAATDVPSSAAQRFQNQGLCDSPGLFLILSGVQIASLYSRHEGENGKTRNHSVYSRKTAVFPEISYFGLCITGQYSPQGPHKSNRGLECAAGRSLCRRMLLI